MAKIFILTDDGRSIECDNAQLIGYNIGSAEESVSWADNSPYSLYSPGPPKVTVTFEGVTLMKMDANPQGIPAWVSKKCSESYAKGYAAGKMTSDYDKGIPKADIKKYLDDDPKLAGPGILHIPEEMYTTDKLTWSADIANTPIVSYIHPSDKVYDMGVTDNTAYPAFGYSAVKGGIKYPSPKKEDLIDDTQINKMTGSTGPINYSKTSAINIKSVKFTPLDKDGKPSKHMHWQVVDEEEVKISAKDVKSNYVDWEIEFTDKESLETIKGKLIGTMGSSTAHEGKTHLDVHTDEEMIPQCFYIDFEQQVTLRKTHK